jgi:PKD repeat protein
MLALANFKSKNQSVEIKRIFVVLLVFLFSLKTYGQDTLSVLFLGNSYTSANNLPQLVKNLTNSAGKTLLVDANIPGGFTISGHLNDATSLNKIRQGNWDYIVIQEQSQIPSIDFYRYNDMYPSLMQLKDTIDHYSPCAKIITYMTWGRRFGGIQCDPSNTYCSPNFVNFNHMQDSLTSAYLEISEQLNIQCVPVGVVWQNVLNDTTLVLHTGDNSHPNIDGSYVAACAIFSSIWKLNSSGLSFTAGLSSPLAQYYQMMADNTIFNSSNDWNLLVNKPFANFSESISGDTATFTNLSTSINNTLDYFWDFGDGSTSVIQNPIHAYLNSGTYNVTLVVSNCIFSDTITKIIRMEVSPSPSIELIIYPNPTTNKINLKADSKWFGEVYSVYDNTGKSVLKGNITSENTIIDLRNLSRAIYFLSVGTHLKQTFKVVKE